MITIFSFVFVFSSMLIMLSVGQVPGTCDQYNNCFNGVCELQPNQQQGCTCNPGFILDPISPLQCLPVPSCNLLQGSPHEQCLNGVCMQQASVAFTCVCYAGYQQSIINPNICENVDECKIPALGCAPFSCTDLIGDYSCTACIRGHTLDQRGKCQRITASAPVAVPPAQQYTQDQNNAALPWLFPMMDSMMF